jgi:hypothetical protein
MIRQALAWTGYLLAAVVLAGLISMSVYFWR